MKLYEIIDTKYNTNLGMYITHIGEEYLNFVAEDIEQAINDLDQMTFKEKLNYLSQLSNEQEREK